MLGTRTIVTTWEAVARALARLSAQLMALLAALAVPALAETRSEPLTIAVHLSSSQPPATGPEEVEAIREFVLRRAELLNQDGGIGGHPIRIAFYDDASDVQRTLANVDHALADPRLIAMIGIWNSTRGSAVVDRIGLSRVPFISEMSVETLFESYPTVYTLTRSVADEQEAFKAFAKDNFKRIAFVGRSDDLYTRAFHAHLVDKADDSPPAASFWIDGEIADYTEQVDRAVREIKESGADLVFLSLGSPRGAAFLARMTAAGLSTPVFVALGSINGLLAEPAGKAYGGPIYEIAEGGIANLNNERLEQLMRRQDGLQARRRHSPYAIGYGARYADLVALVAEAARPAVQTGDPRAMRKVIAEQLASLAEGRRVWRGWAQDWSFTRDRASSERSLLVWRPGGEIGSLLAPIQYVRSGNEITRVPVLYVHLDMVRIYRVDSNDKSFDAEFFFTTRSDREVPISSIEFTNAFHGPGNGEPVINIREVHQDRSGSFVAAGTRIYKVSGRFMFEPDLRKYPFDQQVFSISFQPAKTSQAFFIQPPSEAVRGKAFQVDGWRIESHYVGTNELIIRSVAGPMSEERIIPYYNFNYTWVMKRQVIDYMLRVVVPLTFIIIVAYLAIFIPRAEFEAIMAIQVTALLSAIALYLALNQPSADDATLSDKIFVMAYATISVMIALSIFEVNDTLSRMKGLMRLVHVLQTYLVPVAAMGLIGYVLISASSEEPVSEVILDALRRSVASLGQG